MRTLAIALTITLLSASLALAQSAPDPAFLIVPGVSIGPLKIGMLVDDAVQAIGVPKSTYPGTGGTTRLYWFDNIVLSSSTARSEHGLAAVATAAGELVRIYSHYDPRYVTANGVHTGLTEAQTVAILGTPVRTTKTESNGRQIAHTLFFDGLWLVIVDGPNLNGYRTVAEIAVVAR